jgi:hypothetical protein
MTRTPARTSSCAFILGNHTTNRRQRQKAGAMDEAIGWILVSLAMAAMGWISGQRVGYVAGRQHRRRRAQ